MTRREHEQTLIQAVIRWEAGDGTEAEDEALADAVDEFRRARGDYGPGHKPRDLHDAIVKQLVVHDVPATGEAIAACRTFASGYIALAEADRDLLERLVHEVENTVIEDGSQALRALLDEAYDVGVERPAESQLLDFARRLRRGEDRDEAAIAAGGTGRPEARRSCPRCAGTGRDVQFNELPCERCEGAAAVAVGSAR